MAWVQRPSGLTKREEVKRKQLSVRIENGTAHFKKGKQLFEYHHLLLLRDIWWSKF